MMPRGPHGIFKRAAEIQAKSRPPATRDTSFQSCLTSAICDPKDINISEDNSISPSCCESNRRISHIQLVHSRKCPQRQCQADFRKLDTKNSPMGCRFENSGERCGVIRCNFMAFDRGAVHELRAETSLLKRVVQDLRDEFWALKDVLLESETRRRWNDIVAGEAS